MTHAHHSLDNLKRAALARQVQQRMKARRQSQPARATIPRADRHDHLPLSFAQQRLWFLTQLEPRASLAYHMPSALKLTGTLDRQALQTALNQLVARHEGLRTRFVSVDDQPCQRIDPPNVGFTLVDEDLRGQSASAQDEAVAARTAAEMSQPFDLSTGPLVRGQLLRLDDEVHVLLLTQHHIISDGWSFGVLVRELGTLYQALCDHRDPALPSLDLQYADYAVWQRQQEAAQAFEPQRAFWQQRLADAPALLTLPTDYPRPHVQRYTGHQVPVHIEAARLERLKALAQQHGLTSFMVLVAAWALVLSRLSGQDDLVIGTPVANRQRRELEPVIGFFVNTLALRITLSECDSVSALLTQVRERTLEAYAHQDLPFEQVVEALHPERSLSYSPIFQVMLALNNTPAQTLSLPGLSLTPLAQDNPSAHFDLTLSLGEQEDGIVGSLEYATDLFSHATAERMAGYLSTALDALLCDDPPPLAALSILSDDERHRLLDTCDGGHIALPPHRCAHALFEAHVARHPEAPAVCFEDQTLSYAALDRRANRLAHALLAQGVRPDDRVAVCVERGPALPIALLAVMKAGGAYLPLDPHYPLERLHFMLDDATPRVVLCDRATEHQVAHAPNVMRMDDDETTFGHWPDHAPDPEALGLAPHHLAYVIYTSGSTGQPKGVMIEHRGLCNLILTQQPTLGITADSRVMQCASQSFDACLWECCMALMGGASLHLAHQTDLLPGPALLATLEQHRITHMLLSPTALSAMDDLPATLETLLVGGEACPPALPQRYAADRRMLNAYGPTEITVCASIYHCDANETSAPAIGRPLANTRLYLLDDAGQLVPPGAVGEIHIGGAGVARGYLNRPDLTTVRFLPDPFVDDPTARLYKTGDLARWRRDGTLEYQGRNDFQVKLRGFRIELGEIEHHLTHGPDVRDAVVVARDDTPDTTRLVAYLLSHSGDDCDPAALRHHLAQHLADYMIPSAFVTLDTFPQTPNGKLDRQALPAPDEASVATRPHQPPEGAAEQVLADVWQTLLGLPQVGRFDHFFALGGHSLMVVSMIKALKTHGWSLDLRAVFATPMLADLAKTLTPDTLPEPSRQAPPSQIPEGCTQITPDMLPLVHLTDDELAAIIARVPGGAANVQDIYPLAPLQEGILFHHMLQQAGDDYLLRKLLAFDSRARLDAFVAALQQVIDRHDLLRTAACWESLSRPVQVVWRQAPLSVDTFSPRGSDDVAAQLMAHTDPCHRRLNVQQAPLFSIDIAFDEAQGEWLMALCFHHLVCDHVTMALVGAEVMALRDDPQADLPPAVPYRDFIAQLQQVPTEAPEAYFRELLADVDTPTAPFGIVSTPHETAQLAFASRTLDTTLGDALRRQARHLSISPSALFHIAWARVLQQICGQEDVVFGTVLSGRLQCALTSDNVVGMFINTLPVRVAPSDQHLKAVVIRLQQQLNALVEHEQTPLSVAQRNSGMPAETPLFSTLLNYRHSQRPADTTPTEGIRELSAEEHPHFPLTLAVDDLGDAFGMTLTSVCRLDVERIAEYTVNALTAVVDALEQAPQRSLHQLSILSPIERQRLIETFNDTASPVAEADALVHAQFEAQVARTPDATAVVFEGQSLSFDALNRRANRLAHRLIALGIQPDDRVALCLTRGPDLIVAVMAILKAGGAYLPLDPTYPRQRLDYMLDDAAPVALITESALRDTVVLSAPRPTLLVDSGELPIDTDHNPDRHAHGLRAHHCAYVIYTSGSTGQPKGVMVEHRHLTHLSTALRPLLPSTPSRITLNASLVFDASVKCWLQLLAGHTLVIVPEAVRAESDRLWQYIRQQAVDILDGTPAQIQGLLSAGLTCDPDYQPHTLLIGGEAISPALWARLQKATRTRCLNVYGPTECTVNATACVINAEHETPTLGRPLANVRLYVLDAHQCPVPTGVVGELYIGGGGVARGYLDRPELTADRFLPDPFVQASNARMYRTGDVGRWRDDGTLDYLGRNDFQVKWRGFRIELGEIEAQLVQHPALREAVVKVHAATEDTQQLVAYVTTVPDKSVAPEALRAHAQQHLADYMVPSAFMLLDALPLTPNGKVDRQALPAPGLDAVITRAYAPPEGEREAMLADVWQSLLGLDRIGRFDHFFELGGHSLMVITLIERLRQAGYALNARMLFSSPVLSELAAAITPTTSSPAAPAIPPNRLTADTPRITPDLLPLVDLSQPEIDALVNTVPGGAANLQDVYPLAPLQEGILFQHLLQQEGDAYLMRTLLAFDTRARLDAFLETLQAVIDRHDILRTAACWDQLSRPVQVVWRKAELSVQSFTPEDPTGDIEAQLRAHTDPRHRRLALDQAPLFSADVVLDTERHEWLLAFCFHHLISDHMTLALIMDEITTRLDGNAASLPPAPPYRNFIAQLAQVPAATHEAYFHDMLGDVEAPTLPLGVTRVQSGHDTLSEAVLSVPASLAETLRTQARTWGVSASAFFHLSWAQVLARLSGHDDVVFGTVLSGRLQGTQDADRMLGLFINTLPMRVTLHEASAADALQQTHERLATLIEHEHASLALAQRCSALDPDVPLLGTLLNYRHTHTVSDQAQWPGMRSLAAEERTHYPITVSVNDMGDAFSLVAQTTGALPPAHLLDYMVSALTTLTDALHSASSSPLATLPMFSDTAREQVISRFNPPVEVTDDAQPLPRRFEAQVQRTPQAIALREAGRTLTYQALDQRANRLAHRLITLGVTPEARVALRLERSIDMVVAMLAVLKAGGAYLPLDPEQPAARLAHMLDDAAPVALITDRATADDLIHDRPCLRVDDDMTVDSVPLPDLSATQLAYVIYTSGSTGQPKGVMVEHHSVYRLVVGSSYAPITAKDRVAHCANAAFDASTWEIWAALLNGACLCIVPRAVLLEPERLRDTLIDEGVTALWLTAGLFHTYLDPLMPALARLRYLLVGGDVLDPARVARLQRSDQAPQHLINGYGPTETTTFATTYRIPRDSDPARPVPIGRPRDHARAYVLDAHRQPVPIGVVGELYVAGSGVARGYLTPTGETRFLPDPFTADGTRMYCTGDQVRWREDGVLEYLGRNDRQVKVRGFRIELGEVEAALSGHEAVQDTVVIARPDATGATTLVAYVIAVPDASVTPDTLRRHLEQPLAAYMLPSAFVLLDAFPLTANGKLDRAALPAPDDEARAQQGHVPPEGDLETTIATLWQSLLAVERVGRFDNFFALGGHSLVAVQLLTRMRQHGMDISLDVLFTHPTLHSLAEAVAHPVALPTSPLERNPVPLRAEGTRPPLFLVHEPSGDPLVYSPLAAALPASLPVYALQALGLHQLAQPPASLEALASHHVDAIQRVQPEGPYHLAGWSLGGVIAYAIAQQLRERGEQVAFLGMIDSCNPCLQRTYQAEAPTGLQHRIDMIIGFLSTHQTALDSDALAELNTLDDLEHVLDLCEARQWLPDGLSRDACLQRLETADMIQRLAHPYTPPASDQVVHLLTADTAAGDDVWRGWQGVVSDRSTRHAIGGTHHSIMQPPRRAHIVDVMTDALLPETAAYTPIVTIQAGQPATPALFCVPGAGSTAFSLVELAMALPASLTVHALQARGLTDVHQPPHYSVEQTARAYITALRAHQPHGPYRLLGHSFGGWVAFEIALQLQAQGDTVADIIIVDSDAPHHCDRPHPSLNRLDVLMKLVEIYNMMLSEPLPLTRSSLAVMAADEQLDTLHAALIAAGLMTRNAQVSLLHSIVQVMEANLNTMYCPRGRYEGRVHLVSAEGASDDAPNKWRRYAPHLTSLSATGNHMSMLSPPHVGRWVAQLHGSSLV